MEELLQYLGSIYPLSPELQQHLRSIVHQKIIHKKQYLLRPGQVCREICFIKSGLLNAYYMKRNKQVNSWFMRDADLVVSIESFYLRQESYEYIEALEDTDVYYISYDELENIYRKHIEFNYIARVLITKYLVLWARQLFSLRSQTGFERYMWMLENHPQLLSDVPGKLIASHLNITPETLSKIKGRLRDGVDKTRRKKTKVADEPIGRLV